MISIAIDGPAGSGKSTVAECLAQKTGFVNFDTGALYRAVAYYFYGKLPESYDEDYIKQQLENAKINFKFKNEVQETFLNGENITNKIRSEGISMLASKLSALPCVREFLLDAQRKVAEKNDVIMNGRDIGTVVLPDADIKIFLTASPEVRAERRMKQLGVQNDDNLYKKILKDIKKRDFDDSNREIAPLKKASDAVEVDSSKKDLNTVVDDLYKFVKEKI